LYEGFGLPPVEAMAHGCPVVSSNSSCMPEVLCNAAQFFNPDSCEELRQALELLVCSAERRQQLRDAGFKRCAELTWGDCAKNTLSVYNSVLENHSA
ncbi:MAG: glycosyltransferase, partial [Granulosicoccus sp.]